MLQARSPHRAKEYLRENLILSELLSDNLSDIHEDMFTESNSDDSVREMYKVRVKVQQAPRKVRVLQMRRQLRG
jgi:hypothetical protein